MSRQLTALFVAGAIVFGDVGASASTTVSPPAAAPASTVARNEAPLKPGGPAGIHRAQGIEDVDVWVFSGLILGAIIWILVADDDDEDSTNGTDAD